MLLLDTHAWIWFVQGSEKIKRTAIKIIEESIQQRSLHIAAISQWELAMMIEKGRIILNEPALNWTEAAIKNLHLKILPLNMDIALESCQLPGDFHGDPADRMIVSTARVHNLTLLTKDLKILEYAKTKHVKALEV